MSAPSTFGPYRLVGVSSMTASSRSGSGKVRSTSSSNWRGDGFGLASKCRQEVIIVLEVVADSGRPQPSRHGPSPVGEENAHQQDRQSPAVAGMQSRRQPLTPLGPNLPDTANNISDSPSLALLSLASWKTLVMEEPFSLQDQF